MKKTFLASILILTTHLTLAAGSFGSINNNTGYIIECSQVIGGYCANNPMPANGYIQMLPDPGSKQIRGHIMAYRKNVPGHYTDNLIFAYYKQKNGLWRFQIKSLDKRINVRLITSDTVILTRAGKDK